MNVKRRSLHALTLPTTLTMTLLLWTNSAHGETNCSTSSGAAGVCVTKSALRAEATRVAEGLCSESLKDAELERDLRRQCEGRLAERPIPVPVVERWRAPLWVRMALDVGSVAAAGGAGVCAGLGCPIEATLVVGGVGLSALLVRLVLEVVTR
jgi:hypothetical protein